MELIIGRSIPYRPQWDNTLYPASTCNTTSMVHALEVSGIPFTYPEDMQPEDYLTNILESKEAYSRLVKLYKWAVGKYPPRQVHAMLSWAVNEKLVGTPCTFFTTNATIQEMIYHLVATRTALVVGTDFTSYGHIVTVVGLATAQEDIMQAQSPRDVNLEAISSIIVNDSWGNYLTGYKDRNGFNIRVPFHTYIAKTRTPGKLTGKWVHFFYLDEVPSYLEHLV